MVTPGPPLPRSAHARVRYRRKTQGPFSSQMMAAGQARVSEAALQRKSAIARTNQEFCSAMQHPGAQR